MIKYQLSLPQPLTVGVEASHQHRWWAVTSFSFPSECPLTCYITRPLHSNSIMAMTTTVGLSRKVLLLSSHFIQGTNFGMPVESTSLMNHNWLVKLMFISSEPDPQFTVLVEKTVGHSWKLRCIFREIAFYVAQV